MPFPDQSLSPERDEVHPLVRAFIKEFQLHLNRWAAMGVIPPEQVTAVSISLKQHAVVTYVALFLAENFSNTFLAPLGASMATGYSLAGPLGIPLAELARGSLRNLIVQVLGFKIPFVERQKLGAASMLPVIGVSMPLIFLYHRHPELVRSLYLFLKMRKLSGVVYAEATGGDFSPEQLAYVLKKDLDLARVAAFERVKIQELLDQGLPLVDPAIRAWKKGVDWTKTKIGTDSL